MPTLGYNYTAEPNEPINQNHDPFRNVLANILIVLAFILILKNC